MYEPFTGSLRLGRHPLWFRCVNWRLRSTSYHTFQTPAVRRWWAFDLDELRQQVHHADLPTLQLHTHHANGCHVRDPLDPPSAASDRFSAIQHGQVPPFLWHISPLHCQHWLRSVWAQDVEHPNVQCAEADDSSDGVVCQGRHVLLSAAGCLCSDDMHSRAFIY